MKLQGTLCKEFGSTRNRCTINDSDLQLELDVEEESQKIENYNALRRLYSHYAKSKKSKQKHESSLEGAEEARKKFDALMKIQKNLIEIYAQLKKQ
jgi:hypothetical protein